MNPRGFTATVQRWLIIVLLVALIGVGQSYSFAWYRRSLLVMVVGGLAQIAIGNIPPTSGATRFFRLLLTFLLVIGVVFAVSIAITPWLVRLGR